MILLHVYLETTIRLETFHFANFKNLFRTRIILNLDELIRSRYNVFSPFLLCTLEVIGFLALWNFPCKTTLNDESTISCICQRRRDYSDVIMKASQITSVWVVYSTLCSSADQRKHQTSASLSFVGRIHRWPVNSLHKGPVTRKMLPFDDVIMPWFCVL